MVFVDAELDASLTVGGNVKVEVGKHVFGAAPSEVVRRVVQDRLWRYSYFAQHISEFVVEGTASP